MENISINPAFAGNFSRADVSPLTEQERVRMGHFRTRTMNEKRRKISRHDFPYIRRHITPLAEFDINLVHLNRIRQEEDGGDYIFEILNGPDHIPLFIETRGSDSKLLRSIEGVGNYYGLHFSLESHEMEFFSLLEQLSSQEFIERATSDLSLVPERLDYSISQLSLSYNEDTHEYGGDIKIKLENSNWDFYTPAYDLAFYDNPNYHEAIRTYKNSIFVENYKISDRFNIKAIIHFSYIRVRNRKVILVPFVKEFGYSRM